MYDNSKDVTKWFADGGDAALRYNYPLNHDSLVVDLGGYEGAFADKIFKMYGCSVVIFEPVKAYYEKCVRRNQGNPGVSVVPVGISGYHDGNIEISIEGDASSIFKAETASKKETILLKPVDTLFTNYPVPKVIDLLKINVEGAEFDILKALVESGNINRVTNFQVQFHTFVPDAEAKREILHAELIKTHRLVWNYPFVWENWTKL